ncbi:MAG: hypothetical protein HKN52_10285, partial [Eudoraea sp.]|nr:hypothetical protein [Eudoraea sp.]
MLRKLLFASFLLCSISYGQFNQNAPWISGPDGQPVDAGNLNRQQSIYEISEAFHAYWEGKDPTVKGSGYKPYMRWENYWKYFVDDQGYLPSPQKLWQTWENKQKRIGM